MELTRETYNVSALDYAGYLEQAREHNRDLWENNGWGIRSLEGDEDTLIWTSPYHFRSRPELGPFVFEEASILQTMYMNVALTREQKRQMNDNAFYASGWNGSEELRPPGALTINAGERETVWRIGDMTYRAAPPEWRIEGTDREIGYRFHLKANDQAIWMTDPAKTALETGDRWHMAYVDAEGELKTPERRIHVSGMAWHERHIHLSTEYDPAKLLKGRGLVIHNGFSRDFQIFFLTRPDLGVYRAKAVSPEGRFDFFGGDEIQMKALHFWNDPVSGFHIPYVWHIRMENESARLDLYVQGYARSYYLWNNLRRGVNVLYWWLAESEGEWTNKKAGSQVKYLTGLKHVVHANRTFYHYTGR